ncbi:MAG: hypothetical protein II743_09220 [Lachnospiraceae bacterium]|nr:hypothetical protein [Lachnospiraceae bacterium]MBQ3906937.1 hypothetical protein [Lachnospiraceae bacterium]
MKVTAKVLKINLFSLLALPLLLLATFFKLTAKALEKITIFLGMALLGILLLIVISQGITPKSFLDFLIVLIALIAFCGLAVFIAIWVFGLISGIVLGLWNLMISLFDSLYEITYNWYLSLFTLCEADYRVLSLNGRKGPNAVACIFFTILKGLSWLITTLVSLSYVIAGIFCGGLVLITLYGTNKSMKTAFGLNLIQYAKHCPAHSVLFGILLYIIIIGIVVVGVMALASEWYEWGLELRVTGQEISAEVTALVKSDLRMASGTTEEVEDNISYLRKLEDHLDALEPVSEQVSAVLEKKDSPLLRSYWGIYMRNLNHLVDVCSDKKGIDIKRFKQLIPQIQLLDRQRDDAQKLAAKLEKELATPTGTSIFFSGCDNLEKLEKRYKNLCKTYHPDIAEGDTETFQKMQGEYQTLKAALSNPVAPVKKDAEKQNAK